MRTLLKSSTSAVLALSLALPLPMVTPAQAQNELPECGETPDQTALPCQANGQIAGSLQEWYAVRLIAESRANSMNDAMTMASQIMTGDLPDPFAVETQGQEQVQAQDSGLPACGNRANATPLPCAMGKHTVRSEEEWRIYRLIESGQAGSADEAQMILGERRAARAAEKEAQAEADAEAQAAADAEAQAAADAEAQAAADAAAANPALPQCSGSLQTAKLPCQLAGYIAESPRDYQLLRLIDRGQAATLDEAEAILAERRAERRSAAAAAAAANADAEAAEVETETVTEAETRQADEEFDTKVTGTGQQSVSEDGGLSKFEKALLLGLGAVVVGSVLKNGDEIVSRTGDRVVVRTPDGDLRVLKDDDALVRRPGDEVKTQTFDDGSVRTVVTKPDGSQVITVRGRDGSVLQRVNVDTQGNRYVIIDDTVEEEEVVVNDLPQVTDQTRQASMLQTEADLSRALAAELRNNQNRTFSLRQVREIPEVRALAPELELDAVRFATGSAAIRPEQARSLARIGTTIADLIAEDPRTLFLVEGHTDAVGDATYNLALSDRRAETVALALTQYFNVPPQNLITQGYGEAQLKVPTLRAEAANRRAVVRNITGLLR